MTAEDFQDLVNLSRSIEEWPALLKEYTKYLKEMEEKFEDVESSEYTPPTPEELKIVREQWQTFFDDIADLGKGFV